VSRFPRTSSWSYALALRARLCKAFVSAATCSALLASLLLALALLSSAYTLTAARHSPLAAVALLFVLVPLACLAVLLLTVIVALVVDFLANGEIVQVRYATRRLRRLLRRTGDLDAYEFLMRHPTHHPHMLAMEISYEHRKDEFPSLRLSRALSGLTKQLSVVSERTTPALVNENTPAALGFLRAQFSQYRPPTPPHAVVDAYRSIPELPTHPDREVLFYLSCEHLVERPPLAALTPEQFALRLVLGNLARPLTKDARVRLLLAPAWVHALALLQTERQGLYRSTNLPMVSPAYCVEQHDAVFDLLVGIWSPNQPFDRALAATVKLAKIPSVRSKPDQA